MNKQEGLFPDPNEKQKNAIVLDRKKVDPDFDALSWVLRARSKDELRANLCGLYSDGMGKFVATDGHRLHIAEIPGMTEKIPAGIWLYVHETKKQISILEAPDGMAKYPDTDRVSDMTERYGKKGLVVYTDDSSTVWMYWDLVGRKCNIDYLLDVLKGAEAMDVYVHDEDQSAGVFFCFDGKDGNTKKAILMPFKA